MEIGDAAGWLAAAVGLVGLFFAGRQLQLLREQWAREREIEKKGVAVMWQSFDVPIAPEEDGTGVSTFEFTAYNPGKLPVREVDVRVDFPIDVRREHFDGSLDAPVTALVLDTPVIAGGQHRTWKRTLRINFQEGHRLRELQVKISFYDLEGMEHTNTWGRRASSATDSRTPSSPA